MGYITMEADCQAYVLAKERTSGTMWLVLSQVKLLATTLLGPSSIVSQIVIQFSVPEVGNSNIAPFQISRFRNTELK